MKKYWGIDLGGTKIEGVVFENTASPKVLARLRIPTEAHLGYSSIVGKVKELVDLLSKEVGESPATLGIGTPGICDPVTGLQKNSNTLCLNGMPLKADLSSRLGMPVELANDANCFALAEAVLGAGRGAECVFGVIMGTGVGGGLVLNGRARYGAQGIAGEWGHNVIMEGGASCYCGNSGCIEQIISGPALQQFYKEISGTEKRLSEIFNSDNLKTDLAAQKTKERLLENFGKALSMLINILDPDIIVIGGGVSKTDFLYSEGPAFVKKYVFNDGLSTRIVKNEMGDSAGVFGAALLT